MGSFRIKESALRRLVRNLIMEKKKKGLWANIHAKRKRGEKPAKPGDKDYPKKKAWDDAVKAEADLNEADKDKDGSPAKPKWANKDNIPKWADPDDNDPKVVAPLDEEDAIDEAINEAILEAKKKINKDRMRCNSPRYLRKGEPGYGDKQKVVKACDPDSDSEKLKKFGDANMENKSDSASNKKSFRARHNCADKNLSKDWDTASYWSCKDW